MRDHVVLVTGGTGRWAPPSLGPRGRRDGLRDVPRRATGRWPGAPGCDASTESGRRDRRESVRRLVDEVMARHRRLDALVNAVGAFAAGDLLAPTSAHGTPCSP